MDRITLEYREAKGSDKLDVLNRYFGSNLTRILTAGGFSICRIRFDSALHWVHVTRPPRWYEGEFNVRFLRGTDSGIDSMQLQTVILN